MAGLRYVAVTNFWRQKNMVSKSFGGNFLEGSIFLGGSKSSGAQHFWRVKILKVKNFEVNIWRDGGGAGSGVKTLEVKFVWRHNLFLGSTLLRRQKDTKLWGIEVCKKFEMFDP